MIDIRRILCPIDFSDSSARALNLASSIARWYSARLEVLSVFPTVSVMDLPPRELDDSTRARIVADLQRFTARLPPDVTVETKVEAASEVDREIVLEARELPADLLVMGTHGRSGFRRMLLGSVTERVLRDPPCPVLVVPPATEGGDPAAPVHFRQIVCAVDFSPGSLGALRYALALAQESDARLLVLNVIETPPELIEHPATGPADVDAIRAKAEADRLKRLRELIPEQTKVFCTVETAVTDGAADHAILLAATARHADLVVLGINHHSALDRLVFGSTADRVTRAAPCPVLAVPAETAR
jgi:nucleotide-binding universal stress UspA family protein